MKRKLLLPLTALMLMAMSGCSTGKGSFEDQIKADIISNMKLGACTVFSASAEITDIEIGEITDIGDTGLVDVESSFSFQDADKSGRMNLALLYSKAGSSRKLEKVGSCKINQAE